MASKGRQGDFWYNMYDLRSDEKLPADVEYGLLTHKRDVKGVLKLDTSVQNDATLDRQFNGPKVLLVNSTLNLTIGANQSETSETIVFPPSSRASDGDNSATPSMNQAYDDDEILLPSSEQF
ncbi:hypothetical protein LEN26_011949 [Aphanomyces euteiches]|nr:hypothetical protein LEN26_011949 [Aphanomyces euteiches]